MPGELSARKAAQIRRFIENKKKMDKLRNRAWAKNNVVRDSIFQTNIEGKPRVMKIDHHQETARANLRALLDAHERAIAGGAITATRYILDRTEYQYADKDVGIMTNKVECSG